MSLTRRLLIAASLATGLASLATAASAQVKEIRIDYATYNPVSYMIEGLRSLLITGWDGEALALGFGCALGILAIGLTLASLGLRERMART